MALLASETFRAVRTMTKGTSLPTMRVTKTSGDTWPKGAIIIEDTNLAVEAANSTADTGTVLGVAIHEEATGNSNTSALITPALPGIVFQGQIGTGTSGGTVVTATTHRYTAGGSAYDLATNNDIWYINVGAASDNNVVIIDFVDPVGTAWGVVEFVFIDSMWNPK